MKSELFIEHNEWRVDDKQLVKAAKEIWIQKGNKVKDINNIELYLKPNERKCYYVINDKNAKTEQGYFDV